MNTLRLLWRFPPPALASFRVLAVPMAVAMTACTLAPAYQRPAPPVAATYPTRDSTPADAGAARASAPPVGWRDFFADPRLQALIATALTNNRDLRVATLNVANSQAKYRIQRAQILPAFNASGGESASHTPTAITSPGLPATTHEFSATLGLSAYEIDLFGRLRSLNAQALETYFATEEARRGAVLSLVAEVASDYLSLAADRDSLSLARDTLRSESESYDLTRRQQMLGFASELTVRQAQTVVETARADVARYSSLVAQGSNALELLLGTSLPEDLLPQGLHVALPAIALDGHLPAGLPSDLLQRRPDIAQAEHTLRAANANIGVARAAFFPSVSLTASGGSESLELSSLFKPGSGAWSFAPQVTLPLFAGGRNRANLQSAQISRDIDVASYEHAIQVAFREVADALAQRAQYTEQLSAQVALVDATAASRQLAQARFDKGADSYLNVLDAERSLYSAQQTLITTRLDQASNLVALYRALGGGLQAHAAAPEASTAKSPSGMTPTLAQAETHAMVVPTGTVATGSHTLADGTRGLR